MQAILDFLAGGAATLRHATLTRADGTSLKVTRRNLSRAVSARLVKASGRTYSIQDPAEARRALADRLVQMGYPACVAVREAIRPRADWTWADVRVVSDAALEHLFRTLPCEAVWTHPLYAEIDAAEREAGVPARPRQEAVRPNLSVPSGQLRLLCRLE